MAARGTRASAIAVVHESEPVEDRLDAALRTRGFAVLRGAVPAAAIDAALREIHLDVVRNGLSPETVSSWLHGAHWFPHLKWNEPITNLTAALPAPLREGESCDPQIVLHPPDDCGDVPLTPHVDREPEWAAGRRYRRIVGVALSAARRGNGALEVWPFGGGGHEPVELEPGDVVVMHPELPHTSGLNRSGSIRYAVYFRFLES